jgi:aerobic carbon-monoxide dehydrogenase large subunit
MTLPKFGFGHAVRRKEDDALLRGAGRYVADHSAAGALHGVVLRSPHARASFRVIDIGKAKTMPGVALVLTGTDTSALGDLPCQGAIPDTKIATPPYPILARGEVKHVGDAVAFVVADTLDQARDGAEAIAVEWAAQPHIVGAAAALEPGAPPVWPKTIAPHGNLAFETVLGDPKATARAFATAARTVSLSLVNQRLVTNYLDTRGVLAEYAATASATSSPATCSSSSRRSCASSPPTSAAASAPSSSPIANMRWRRSPRGA